MGYCPACFPIISAFTAFDWLITPDPGNHQWDSSPLLCVMFMLKHTKSKNKGFNSFCIYEPHRTPLPCLICTYVVSDPPCAWWFCAVQALPCQSSFEQHSWRTGPSSWCTGHCEAHLSGSTLHLSAELSPHAKSGSHTSPQHYWWRKVRKTLTVHMQIKNWED